MIMVSQLYLVFVHRDDRHSLCTVVPLRSFTGPAAGLQVTSTVEADHLNELCSMPARGMWQDSDKVCHSLAHVV